MTLAADEFIRRFLLHVLLRGFHPIRHYGLLASSARKDSLALARKLLAVSPQAEDPEPDEMQDTRPPCPCCGGNMTVIETFARWCQPRAPPKPVTPIPGERAMTRHGLPSPEAAATARRSARKRVPRATKGATPINIAAIPPRNFPARNLSVVHVSNSGGFGPPIR